MILRAHGGILDENKSKIVLDIMIKVKIMSDLRAIIH